MWAFPLDDGKILVCLLKYDRTAKTLEPVPDLAIRPDGPFRPFMSPMHFGDQAMDMGFVHRLECYPVPGQPGKLWAVRIAGWDETARRELRGIWTPERTVWTVGLLSPERAILAGKLKLKDVRGASGVFSTRLAAVSPSGDLFVPGHRITGDMKIIPDPSIGSAFQGFWLADGKPVVVSGFRGRSDGAEFRIRPPISASCARQIWCSHDDHHGLWLFWSKGNRARSVLAAVSPSGDACGLLVSGLLPESVFSLPDGRWAGLMITGKHADDAPAYLVVGNRDRWRVYLESPSLLGRLLGVFPLSGNWWAVVGEDGFCILEDLEQRDVVRVPLDPVLVLPESLVTRGRSGFAILPDRPVPVREIDRFIHRSPFDLVMASGRLGCIRIPSPIPDQNRFYLLPSGKVMNLRISVFLDRLMLYPSDEGFLVLEDHGGGSRAHILNPGGETVARVFLGEGIMSRHVTPIPTDAGYFLLVAVVPSTRSLRLMTVDRNGSFLDVLEIPGVFGRVRFVDRLRSGQSVIFRMIISHRDLHVVAAVHTGRDGKIGFRILI